MKTCSLCGLDLSIHPSQTDGLCCWCAGEHGRALRMFDPEASDQRAEENRKEWHKGVGALIPLLLWILAIVLVVGGWVMAWSLRK